MAAEAILHLANVSDGHQIDRFFHTDIHHRLKSDVRQQHT